MIIFGWMLGATTLGGGSAVEEFLDTDQREVSKKAEKGFSDIDAAGVHRPGVERLAIEGVLAGTDCAAAEFCPNDPIQRWVVAVWLLRVLEEAEPPGVEFSRFADVDPLEWWVPYAERLAVLGVDMACSDSPTRFCPTEPIRREQVASILAQAFQVDPEPSDVFADVEGDNPHAPDIHALGVAGVAVGCYTDPARFCPSRESTRAEMATFLVRAWQLETVLAPAEEFVEVTAGRLHSCALRKNGSLTCWGSNDYGQLYAPEGEFTAVAAGGWHSCALRKNGSLTCWGSNDRGQLYAPEGEFTAVAAGGWHSCALRKNGSLTCWGSNDYGQLYAPEGEFTAVAAGGWHSCALRKNGTLTCWGSNDYGQLYAPEGEFTAVAAGGWHSCAVRTDRLISCWGRNGWGEGDAPARHFNAVAAGFYLTCGLRTDHNIDCWGAGPGQAHPREGKFVALTASLQHSCGVDVDGTITCWGVDSSPVPVGVQQHTLAGQPDPDMCRPGGPAGFPRPQRVPPSVGSVHIAVLFVDFPDASAAHTTHQEAELGVPFMKEYLETVSYGKLNLEFEYLHRWLRVEQSYLHYIEPGAFEVGDRVPQEAVRLADPELDFAEFDMVMVVLPGSFFYSGIARGSVSTDEGVINNTIQINAYPLGRSREPRAWGLVGAQEIASSFGLVDLFPYDGTLHRHPQPPSDEVWITHQFGLMGLRAFFSTSERDPRLRHVWHYPSGYRFGAYARFVHAAEMLAWSRWLLGWLDGTQVRCITAPQTTITLRPIAFPGDKTAMVAVPLSLTEVIVIESRRKLGFDHGVEHVVSEGPRTVLPALAAEGVLVYTVNTALGSGSLPITVAGDPGNGHFDDYPLLTEGQSITVQGHTVAVASTTYETHTITVTREEVVSRRG